MHDEFASVVQIVLRFGGQWQDYCCKQAITLRTRSMSVIAIFRHNQIAGHFRSFYALSA
jgi:hypothetical protein